MSEKPVQSKVVMALVCWFVGVFGIHRLLMGHSNWWIQLITACGCGFWVLYDPIMILTGSLKMADGRELS